MMMSVVTYLPNNYSLLSLNMQNVYDWKSLYASLFFDDLQFAIAIVVVRKGKLLFINDFMRVVVKKKTKK